MGAHLGSWKDAGTECGVQTARAMADLGQEANSLSCRGTNYSRFFPGPTLQVRAFCSIKGCRNVLASDSEWKKLKKGLYRGAPARCLCAAYVECLNGSGQAIEVRQRSGSRRRPTVFAAGSEDARPHAARMAGAPPRPFHCWLRRSNVLHRALQQGSGPQGRSGWPIRIG